jgi:hypothetical protein
MTGSIFHQSGVGGRRNFLPGIVEKGPHGGVHLFVEEDDVAAMGEDQSLAVGEVVMDPVDVEGAAGGVELAVAEERGFVGVKGLFCCAGDRRNLPAVAELPVDVVDAIAAHEGVEVVQLIKDAFLMVGGLVGAIDGEPHAVGAVGRIKDVIEVAADPGSWCPLIISETI